MFKRGDIVWGKIKTYPWWPAIVLNPKDCGRDKVGRNKFWIFWFGDHKITQRL
ncbi:unnamed protein product [Larinioides sclopetarius]|uniref:PWWP domain-containing protein n=1 Tax=Larinioides sclopetarius TaxID=280406 RepID=A0AAV1ZXH6_9ARAC